MTVRNEEYYKRIFEPYPDVVTLEQFRTMLGGIGIVQRENLRGTM